MKWHGKKWNGKQQPSCGEEYQTGFSSVFYIVKVILDTKKENEKKLKSKTLERKSLNLGRKSGKLKLENWFYCVTLVEFPFCNRRFSFHWWENRENCVNEFPTKLIIFFFIVDIGWLFINRIIHTFFVVHICTLFLYLWYHTRTYDIHTNVKEWK